MIIFAIDAARACPPPHYAAVAARFRLRAHFSLITYDFRCCFHTRHAAIIIDVAAMPS